MSGTEKSSRPADPTPPEEWPGGDLPPVEAYEDEAAAAKPPHRNGHDTHSDPLAARTPLGFRQLPHNTDAEQALLGAILVNNEAYHRVAAFLRPEHFYEPPHVRIYAAAERLIKRGRIADHVTMAEQFDQDEDLKELDGSQYLAAMARAAETVLNAEDYGQLIQDLAVRRAVIAVGEAAVNTAYDPASAEPAQSQLEWVRERLGKLAGDTIIRSRPCDLPALDWSRIANEEPPAERWLINQWIPTGTSGLTTGPGAAGKSYLELIKLICLAAGLPFLGHYDLEPIPCLGYFAEDSEERLWARARKICAALQIDPAQLIGRLDIVSTVGSHRHLITAEHNNPATFVTEWLHQIHDRAREKGVRYIGFDHVGRYLAISRNDPNQVFSAFSHMDALATSIDGSIGLLAHPSKTDIRNKAKGGGSPIIAYVGGCAAMIDAPRWVHVLDTVTFPEGKCRVLTNEKANYIPKRFAAKIPESAAGIVEFAEEVDPDDPTGEKSSGSLNPRHRPSNADRTFNALRELFLTHRRAIAIDEIVSEAIRTGNLKEADKESMAWRDRRKTVRQHLHIYHDLIDQRDDDCFALKPEAIQ